MGVPVAFVLGTTSVALTDLGIHICDDLCHMILRQTGPDTAKFFTHLAVAPAGGAIPTVVTALLSVLLLIGAVLLWLEMLMRATAIYVAAFFLPLALAGLVWPATSRMMKRLAEVLVALVFSKFVVVATLALGMGAASSSSGVGAAVTGGAIMLLAAFAPVILLRLIPVVEVAAIDHMAHLGRRSLMAGWRGANEVVAAPGSALVGAMRNRFGRGAPGGDGGDGPAAATPRIANRKPDFVPASGHTGPAGTDGGSGPAGRARSAGRPGGQPSGPGPSGASTGAAAAGTGFAGAAAGAGMKAAATVGARAAASLPAMTEPPRREPESGDGR